jgi:hypothetical protein
MSTTPNLHKKVVHDIYSMKHEDETFQEQHIRKIHDMLTNLVSQRTTSVMAPSVIIGGKMFEE